jgi:hypothetical protein
MLMLEGNRVRHVQLSPDDGKASLYPDLQVNASDDAALTWFDEKDGNREIYLQVGSLGRLGASTPPAPVRVTMNEGDSIGAYVAWNDQVVGLTWTDEIAGRVELFSQQFGASGRPLGSARQVGRSVGRASVPAIRAYGSGFLLAWNDYVAPASAGHDGLSASKAQLAWIPIARP